MSADRRKLSEASAQEAAGITSDLASSASSLSLKEAFQKKRNLVVELEEWLPPIVSQYSFEMKNKIASYLNPTKEQGNDWRLVASKLKFKNNFIEQVKNVGSPTEKLLDNCTNIPTKNFLAVLNDPNVGRTDVICEMWELAQPPGTRERSPTQETVSSGWCYSPSSSFDNEMPRYDCDSGQCKPGTVGRQPSEQDAEDEIPPTVSESFFSDESKEFWKSVPGGSWKEKNWSDFVQAIKNSDFADELKAGAVDRFLCYVLKLDYARAKDQVVTVDNFQHLVGWFGPFHKGGCLSNMYKLMNGSVSRSADNTKQSWFAGYQELEEDERKLRDQKPGCFLIRFSTSRADDGFFTLAVKTETEVKSFQIEASPRECTHLTLAGQTYANLLELVDDLRNNFRLEECREILTNPCPNLPLNAIFKGYTSSTGIPAAQRGRRGRGRSRNIQQS